MIVMTNSVFTIEDLPAALLEPVAELDILADRFVEDLLVKASDFANRFDGQA